MRFVLYLKFTWKYHFTVDLVGLYPNIPHNKGMSALRKQLDNRMEKYIESDTLCDLVDVILKNNTFKC